MPADDPDATKDFPAVARTVTIRRMSPQPKTHRRLPWAMRGVALAVLLIAAGYGMAFGGADRAWIGAMLLAAGNAILAPCAMALGAPLAGPWRRVIQAALWGTGLVLLVSVLLALSLPAPDATTRVVLGFPGPVAVVIFGVGVVPLLVLPVLFALSFDEAAFAPKEVERVKALTPSPRPPESGAAP